MMDEETPIPVDRLTLRERCKRALVGFLPGLKELLAGHYFTAIAVVGMVLLVLFVPQISGSMFEIPTDSTQAWGFALYLSVILAWLVSSILGFLNVTGKTVFGFSLLWLGWLARKTRSLSERSLGYWIPAGMIFQGTIIILLVGSDAELPIIGSLFTGTIRILCVCAIVASVWLLFGKWFDPAVVTKLSASEGENPAPLPTEADLSGKELAAFKRQRAQAVRRDVWQQSGKTISFLVSTVIIGEVIWLICVTRALPLASLRLYSIWAVFQICATVIVAAALVDFLQRRTTWPWRLIATCTIVLGIVISGAKKIPTKISPVSAVAVTNVASTSDSSVGSDPWYDAVNERLDAMPQGPVVLVTASGGGSRAALFTALVLEYMHQIPMELPVLAPDGTVHQGKRDATWGDHILAISSVSGGTLASARYIDLLGQEGGLKRHTHEDWSDIEFTDFRELIAKASVFSEELITKSDKKSGDRELEALKRVNCLLMNEAETRAPLHVEAAKRKPMMTLFGAANSCSDPEFDKCLDRMMRSKFVDEMGIDFMAPILRGVLQPLETRGDGLHAFWERQYGWSGWTRSNWSDRWSAKKQPLWLVNVTDIDHGRRIVIGCPALPKGLLPAVGVIDQSSEAAEDEVGQDMNDDDEMKADRVQSNPYEPYAFIEIDPNHQAKLTMSRLVRLSSSFPFGFRPTVTNVDAPERKILTNTKIHLLDGGIVDNTGIDSFHALFARLIARAQSGEDSDALKLLGRLRRRGVVLVEIDSGAKRNKVASDLHPLRIIMQPIGALSATSYSAAERTSDAFLADLQRQLSADLGLRTIDNHIPKDYEVGIDAIGLTMNRDEIVELATGVLTVPDLKPTLPTFFTDALTCNSTPGENTQVMTSFALTPEDKAKILTQFLIQRLQWEESMTYLDASLRDSLNASATAALDQQNEFSSFFRLLEIGKHAKNQIASELNADEPTLTEQELRERMKLPLAAYTVAGFFAEANSDDDTYTKIIDSFNGLSDLVKLVSNGRTDQLLVDEDPARQFGIEIRSSVGEPIEQKLVGTAGRRVRSLWMNAARQSIDAGDVLEQTTLDIKDGPAIAVEKPMSPKPTAFPMPQSRARSFEQFKQQRKIDAAEFYHTR